MNKVMPDLSIGRKTDSESVNTGPNPVRATKHYPHKGRGKEIQDLLLSGVGKMEVARLTGCSAPTITHHAKKIGLSLCRPPNLGPVLVVCAQCSKEFNRPRKWFNQNLKEKANSFCSSKCSQVFTRKAVVVRCANCGKESIRIPAELKKSKTGKYFCSHACSNTAHNKARGGEIHPLYAGGTTLYRKRAFERYGRACTVCRYDIECVLEVHHRDGNRKNNKVENLDVLCPTHHDEFEHGIRAYSQVV